MRTRLRNSLVTALASLAVMGAGVVGTACGLRAKPTGGASKQAPAGGSAPTSWGECPFEPMSVRIHPLTRVGADPETGEARIEVFLEPLDRWNHGIKALGVVVLELYETAGPASSARGGPHQIQLWKVDLTDPDANAEPYDRVTRTYHLSLATVPTGLPPERDLMLSVRFTTASGRQLVANHRFGSP